MRKALKPIIAYSVPTSLLFAAEAFAGSKEAAHHGVDAHAQEAAAHTSSGLPQIDPEWFASQIFWLAVTFMVLYVIFGKKVLPELSAIIDSRREHISENLSAAQSLKEEAEEVQAAYEGALREARNKSSELFAAVEDKIKDKTEKQQVKFQEKSMQAIRDTEAEIDKAMKNAMDDMTTIAAEVASEAAGKIVGIDTDVKQAKTVVKNINKKAA